VIVIAAVIGECCVKPHLRIVEVPTSDESVAVTVAKHFLEFGEEGWDPGDAIALSIAALDPDYTVPKEEVPVWGLQTGDEIWWEDPDDSACSRVLKVKNVTFMGDRGLSIEEDDGSVVEGYVREFIKPENV
jgi:hypothetical protein